VTQNCLLAGVWKKYNESAHLLLTANLISQPHVEFPPVWASPDLYGGQKDTSASLGVFTIVLNLQMVMLWAFLYVLIIFVF
jgi:hypothetical protein